MTVVLFVYGTLGPGEDAWSFIAPYVDSHREAAAPGRLYDTGRGYPGAVFAAGEDLVHGWCRTLDDPDLDALDAFEGAEYRRVTVRCADGVEAIAYDWIAPLDGCEPVTTGCWRVRP